MPLKRVNFEPLKGEEVVVGTPVRTKTETGYGEPPASYDAIVGVEGKRLFIKVQDLTSYEGLTNDIRHLPPMAQRFVKKLIK